MRSFVLTLILLAASSAHAQFTTAGLGADSIYLVSPTGNSITLRPGSISSSYSLTLPGSAGNAGEVLQTDGSGSLGWTSISSSGNPAGTIIAFAGATCPSGYLAANGQTPSRTTYAVLWNALGGTSSPWGQGDGSTTFTIPDLQNRFLRGTGTNTDGKGGTPVAIGEFQNDAFQGHFHSFIYREGVAVAAGTSYVSPSYSGSTDMIRQAISDGTNGIPRTDSETRPKSYGVLMCIKY